MFSGQLLLAADLDLLHISCAFNYFRCLSRELLDLLLQVNIFLLPLFVIDETKISHKFFQQFFVIIKSVPVYLLHVNYCLATRPHCNDEKMQLGTW